ncbi:hypothetical protein ASG29_07765 [Sphingomonas sp. Leaf412]|uniref:DUF2306 domain-containing protein n=1 Tax=Sphingomonas sp. Leaf412 TaxID=1736370 RepID=UPI0006F704EA|nr:hypothetical protein [Sphingomonas sp. Leaf412]KQT31798.1 hypothetical protein ASG29_07765 [Sphingomonas sp. Leaf412]
MATTAYYALRSRGRAARDLRAPGRLDQVLSLGAVVLLAFALAAIGRGAAQWATVPAVIWLHLLTILTATALTPVMLLRRRGDRPHRMVGAAWLLAMFATALATMFIRTSGGFSVIHILSVWTMAQVPLIWWTARTHRIARHRRAVHGLVIGALLIAGFFTFPFQRLLGSWLFA